MRVLQAGMGVSGSSVLLMSVRSHMLTRTTGVDYCLNNMWHVCVRARLHLMGRIGALNSSALVGCWQLGML
jgi:hypothetical protein